MFRLVWRTVAYLVLTALLAVKAIVFARVEQQVVATMAFKELG